MTNMIVFKRHANGWKVYLNDDLNIWEFGKTKQEALFQLAITLNWINRNISD